MVYAPTMEHYLAIKSNKLLMHDTSWKNIKNVMLKEKSQIHKCTYCMAPFVCHLQKRQIYRDGKQISVCLRLGMGMWADCKWA